MPRVVFLAMALPWSVAKRNHETSKEQTLRGSSDGGEWPRPAVGVNVLHNHSFSFDLSNILLALCYVVCATERLQEKESTT